MFKTCRISYMKATVTGSVEYSLWIYPIFLYLWAKIRMRFNLVLSMSLPVRLDSEILLFLSSSSMKYFLTLRMSCGNFQWAWRKIQSHIIELWKYCAHYSAQQPLLCTRSWKQYYFLLRPVRDRKIILLNKAENFKDFSLAGCRFNHWATTPAFCSLKSHLGH